jgi:basic membrane protein A and related proteins
MKRARLPLLTLGLLVLLLVPVLSACGTSSGGGTGAPPVKQTRICLITDKGGLNDRGFNHLADVGLTNAEQQLGVTGKVLESHSANDYVPNLTTCATSAPKYDLIIAVGFDFAQTMATIAQQFPNQHFAMIDASPLDANFNPVVRPNVLALFFREQEAGALVGIIAGTLEKDHLTAKKMNTIGAIGGEKIPPVTRYIAGYKWAATMADPGIKVLIGYSNNFTDPSQCTGITDSQIASGADVVFQVAGGCGLGVLQEAGKKGVYSIGVDSDQKTFDSSVIASALKRVDVATFDAIKFIKDGTLPVNYQATGEAACDVAARTCSEFLFSLQNGGIGYAPGNVNLPADATAAESNLESQIKSGAQTPPENIP